MAVTHGSIGAGESLVGAPTSTTVSNKSIVAGKDISLSSDADEVTINKAVTPKAEVDKFQNTEVTNGTNHTINWDEDIFYSTAGMWSDSPNPDRVTIVTPGYYHVILTVCWEGNASASGTVDCAIHSVTVGGSSDDERVRVTRQASSSDVIFQASTVLHLTTDDWVYATARNNSGVTLDLKTFGSEIYAPKMIVYFAGIV